MSAQELQSMVQGIDPTVGKAVGGMLKKMVESMKESRKEAMETGREIMKYGFSKDYAFEYQKLNPSAWFKAKYAKTAEAFMVIVPRLIPGQTIKRLLIPRVQDPAVIARTQARETYLNITPMFNQYIKHRRKATQDAVAYGRGVMWTGINERTGMCSSEWDSVENLLVDANAKIAGDIHAIARIRDMPRWQAAVRFPSAKRAILNLPEAGTTKMDSRQGKEEKSSDCVRLFFCYFDKGLQNYKGGMEVLRAEARTQGLAMSGDQLKDAAYSGDDSPKLYVISDDATLLAVEDWETPFHKLPYDPWPCTMLDYYDGEGAWPKSMLEPGLGIQKAMNHLVTLAMSRMRNDMRTVYATKKQNRQGLSKEDIRRVLNGSDIESIQVEFNGETASLKDFIEKFDWSMGWINPVMQYLQMLESLYERLTGMYAWLHTGQGATQDRSAQATVARERNSMARIEDMRDTGKEFDSMLARKEAFCAAYHKTSQDVAKIMPPDQAANWGQLIPDQTEVAQQMMQMLAPQGIQMPQATMLANVNYFMQKGADPMMAQQMAMQAYTLDEIAYMTDFDIEGGSMRRKDIDQQLDLIKEQKNTVMPLQLQSPDPAEKAMAYDLLAVEGKLAGLPQSLITGYENQANIYRQVAQAMLMAPPPAPAPAQESETEDKED